MTKTYKINGQDLTIQEYNNLYYSKQHPILIKLQSLYDELFGCYGIGSINELDKSKSVNRNLYADFKNAYDKYDKNVGQNYPEIWRKELGHNSDDDETKTLASLAKSEKLIQEAQKVVNLGEQLKNQRDETGNEYNEKPYTPSRLPQDKEKDLTQKLVQAKLSAIEEINNCLNQTPPITTEELEGNNQTWQANIEHAMLDVKEVNDIKERVLNDIKSKRTNKQNKENENPKSDDKLAIFKRDAIGEIDTKKNAIGLLNESDLDTANHNWRQDILEADSENKINLIKARVLADIRNREDKKNQQKDQAKASAQKLANATKEEIDEMQDKQLEESMVLFTRLEGEEGLTNTETTAQIEARLIKDNPQLYIIIIGDALQERMIDYGIAPSQLDEETRKLLRGEITDVNKVKEIKDKAVKEIGTEGAKNKWSSLMNQAKLLLDKAKNKITEQIKKDLKEVQSQLKNFKSGTNSYLTSTFKSNKNEGEKLEKQLNSCLNNQEIGSPKGTPWGIIIPVSLVAVVVIAAAVVVIRKRKQSRRI